MGILEEAFQAKPRLIACSGLSSLATVVKLGEGKIYSFAATNDSSAIRVLKIYDKATAVDPLTDTAIYRAVIAPSATHSFTSYMPIPFSSGFNVLAISTIGEGSGGSPGAGYVMFNALYN